ncbi:MAG: ion transporter [Bacteroidota bacterium]
MLTKRQRQLYIIIFESDTKRGKLFDVILLILILLSVLTVMLDSVPTAKMYLDTWFYYLEWSFTILFTVEYVLRIYSSPKKRRYLFSFYGIIDLLSILPTYISLFIAGTKYLIIIRILRLLRVFRVLKLVQFMGASDLLANSLKASKYKIVVFLEVVLMLVVLMGSLMYLIEGPENGFDSIPRSIYWAIVTLTTVGYGDISPQTFPGQALASVIMIIGYAIIAVPTGIISAEIAKNHKSEESVTFGCKNCGNLSHDDDALYCKKCGTRMRKKAP